MAAVRPPVFRPVRGSEFKYAADFTTNKAVNSFLCGGCKAPWVEPVTHSDCGATFCSQCVANVTICPGCESPCTAQQIVPFRAVSILNTLDSLQVLCPTCQSPFPRKEVVQHWAKCKMDCPKGCGEKVAPSEFDEHTCRNALFVCPRCLARGRRDEILSPDHESICPFDCPNGCGAKLTIKDVPRHNELCTELVITCERCKEQMKRGKYTVDHSPFCPIPCGCGTLIHPKLLLSHFASGCKLAPIPCRGSPLLCPWIGTVALRDEHERNCRFLAMSDVLQPLLQKVSLEAQCIEYNKSGKQLCGQDFSRRCLRCWDFSGADLTGCNFEGSDLSHANLNHVIASGANFALSKLKGANLEGGNFTGANFQGANLTKANLTEAIIANAYLSNVMLQGAKTKGTRFTNSRVMDVTCQTSTVPAASTFRENYWQKFSGVALSDNNRTVSNSCAKNGASIIAMVGVKVGQSASWKIKLVAGRDVSFGVARSSVELTGTPPTSGCWTVGRTALSGCNVGDTIKFSLDRLYANSPLEVKLDMMGPRIEVPITTAEEVYPFLILPRLGDQISAQFDDLTELLQDAKDKPVLGASVSSAPPGARKEPSGSSETTECASWQFAEDTHDSVIFYNGNMSVLNTGTQPQVITSTPACRIKWGAWKYWEMKVHRQSNKFSVGVTWDGLKPCVGKPWEKGFWNWESSGRTWGNGYFMEQNNGFSDGDTIGICVERLHGFGTLLFTKNGKVQTVIPGGLGMFNSGTIVPFAVLGWGDCLTACFRPPVDPLPGCISPLITEGLEEVARLEAEKEARRAKAAAKAEEKAAPAAPTANAPTAKPMVRVEIKKHASSSSSSSSSSSPLVVRRPIRVDVKMPPKVVPRGGLGKSSSSSSTSSS
ncbi:hypothetical protein Pelo_9764 [Pelomyxa schiedti]|nr:hypothetical protein Pelo_9764 [Pelomyxa schiedti]